MHNSFLGKKTGQIVNKQGSSWEILMMLGESLIKIGKLSKNNSKFNKIK